MKEPCQGCEVVECIGLDCYFTEAEDCIEGSLQEQEVLALDLHPKKTKVIPRRHKRSLSRERCREV